VGLWWGTLIGLFFADRARAIIARITQLTWPIAIAVGPALTYGVVALAIIRSAPSEYLGTVGQRSPHSPWCAS